MTTRPHRIIGSLALIAALAAMLASIACSGITQDKVTTNSSNRPALTLNVSNLDFGNVAVGTAKSHNITLTNASAAGAAITVSQADVSGAGFSLNLGSLPITIMPGSSVNLIITFAPSAAGTRQGSLSIAASGTTSAVSAGLSGTGTASARLTVSPQALNFGSLTLGDTATQSGTLTAGAADVTVSSAQWNGSGFAMSGISFPVTIKAGKSVPYTVIFTPEAAGQASGGISFISDAANSPVSQTFSGAGGAPAAAQHSVTVSWIAGSSPAVGYNIYRGTTSGGPYARLNATPQSATTYVDHSVEPGTIYYYVATSVDANNAESGYSGEVAADVPSR